MNEAKKIKNDSAMSLEEKALYHGFIYNLMVIFGKDIFEVDETGDRLVTYFSSTSGWDLAFKNTCRSLGFEKLYDFYDKLTWEKSDLLDEWVMDNLIKTYEDIENELDYLHSFHSVSKDRTHNCDHLIKKFEMMAERLYHEYLEKTYKSSDVYGFNKLKKEDW